jgi:hypothetical protein
VPILGGPAPFATVRALVGLRLRRAARISAARWAGAALGAGAAGAVAGTIGGLILTAAPGSTATFAVVPVLAAIGACCGAAGGAGVGAGLSVAEAVARSRRATALIPGAAAGGLVAGALAQWLARATLATIVGLQIPIGGSVEGLAIGSAAGLAYAVGTRRAHGGLAAPRGAQRLRVALLAAAACGIAALALTMAGRPLAGGTIHLVARASQGSQVVLTPLARLIGEPDLGPISAAILGTGEGAIFGLGLAFGLTRRP